MRLKLKTLKQLKEEFPNYVGDGGKIYFNDFEYYITVEMLKVFGKYIDVTFEDGEEVYISEQYIGDCFCKEWFEDYREEEFFKEEDFEI